MSPSEEQRRSEALGWVIRLREVDFADWEEFTIWLEEHPANAVLYDSVALADRDIAAALKPVPPGVIASNNNMRQDSRRFRIRVAWGTIVAAALAAAVAYPLLAPQDDIVTIATNAGEHRNILLKDGTRIELNGGSRLSLHSHKNRLAALDSGEATFSVMHDAAHPFVVEVGDIRLQDLGTVFNVAHGNDTIDVSVAQGSVLYNPEKEAVTLIAGHMIRVSHQGGIITGSVDPAAVATWRHGRLVYQDASLQTVASDLSRNLGVTVSTDPEIATRSFSGVLVLNGDRKQLFDRLGAVLDVRVIQQGKNWRLAPSVREAR